MPRSKDNSADRFDAGSRAKRTGLIREFWALLSHNKKWWLFPILIVLLLVGLLVMLTGSGVAPFIYTLF